jgi:hypothetical protein
MHIYYCECVYSAEFEPRYHNSPWNDSLDDDHVDDCDDTSKPISHHFLSKHDSLRGEQNVIVIYKSLKW